MQDLATDTGRRWRNAPVTRQYDVRRARTFGLIFLGIVLAVAPLGAYQVAQMRHVQVTYEIEALRAEKNRLVETEKRLRIERARLEALSLVERRAASTLGLERPGAERIIVVDDAWSGSGARR